MRKEQNDNAEQELMIQRLSLLVRARLLFKREIKIDAGGTRMFDLDFLIRLIGVQKQVDAEMAKMLSWTAGATFLLYLVGAGSKTPFSVWGLNLTDIPGIAIFLSLVGAFSLAMAAFSFLNSQSYDALIDQVILHMAKDGMIDSDAIKASYAREWLILKVLRKDFSFYTPVHISMSRAGRVFSASVMFIAVTFILLPFISLVFALPFLAITVLPNGPISIVTKGITVASSVFVFLTMLTLMVNFKCSVKIENTSPRA